MAKTDEQPVRTADKKKEQTKEQLPCLIRHFTLITRVTAVIVIAGIHDARPVAQPSTV